MLVEPSDASVGDSRTIAPKGSVRLSATISVLNVPVSLFEVLPKMMTLIDPVKTVGPENPGTTTSAFISVLKVRCCPAASNVLTAFEKVWKTRFLPQKPPPK
jgi:hypothetical protein